MHVLVALRHHRNVTLPEPAGGGCTGCRFRAACVSTDSEEVGVAVVICTRCFFYDDKEYCVPNAGDNRRRFRIKLTWTCRIRAAALLLTPSVRACP